MSITESVPEVAKSPPTDDPMLRRQLTADEAKSYARSKLYAMLERVALALISAVTTIAIALGNK